MKATNFFGFTLFATAILFASCGGGETAPVEETPVVEAPVEMTLTVDPTASAVVWKGTMLGIKSHEGNINLTQGNVTVVGTEVKGGSFTVDMKTVAPTDANYDEENTMANLVGHLSSPDFFAVDSFPNASFTINSVEGNKAMGALTVRGITNEETVENITVSEADGKVTITGTMTFDRKKYNVAWDSPMKEAVLSNDIELNISLVANK